MIGKTLRSEICWNNRGIVALQSLQVSCLSDMHSQFYLNLKLKKWMCELCMFSQIRSHMSLLKTLNNFMVINLSSVVEKDAPVRRGWISAGVLML